MGVQTRHPPETATQRRHNGIHSRASRTSKKIFLS
jgi:hypothetical protein